MFLNGAYPTLEQLPKWITPGQAGTAVHRIGEFLNGREVEKFDHPIKVNKKAAKDIFEELAKEPWNTAYYNAGRKIKMDIITDALGGNYFEGKSTYASFKAKAVKLLRENKIVFNVTDLNELTGLSSAADNKMFTSSQFVNLLDSEFNRVHHASMLKEYGRFEQKLQKVLKHPIYSESAATQVIEDWKDWRKGWFDDLPKKYQTKGIKSILPSFKLGEDAAVKKFGQRRLNQLLDLGLDVADEAKTAGYLKTFGSAKIMSKMPVLKELATSPEKTLKLLKRMGYGKGCKASGGRVGFAEAGAVTGELRCVMNDVKKTQTDLNSPNKLVSRAAILKNKKATEVVEKIPEILNIMRRGGQRALAGISGAIGGYGGLALEAVLEGAVYEWYKRQGYTDDQAYAETFTLRLLDEARKGKSTEDVPWYGGAGELLEKELIGTNEVVQRYVDNEKALLEAEAKYNQLYGIYQRATIGPKQKIRDPEKADQLYKALEFAMEKNE